MGTSQPRNGEMFMLKASFYTNDVCQCSAFVTSSLCVSLHRRPCVPLLCVPVMIKILKQSVHFVFMFAISNSHNELITDAVDADALLRSTVFSVAIHDVMLTVPELVTVL